MTVAGAVAGGVIGTAVLTSGFRVAQAAGETRMDMALLLGTAFSGDRNRANLIGYVLHFANGLLFALGYVGIFAAVGHAGWLFGLLLGAVHALVTGGPILNVLLPAVHPRMGTPWTDAEETPLLESPGFLLTNYGPRTAVVYVVLHLAFGAIVGGFAAGF